MPVLFAQNEYAFSNVRISQCKKKKIVYTIENIKTLIVNVSRCEILGNSGFSIFPTSYILHNRYELLF